MPDIGHWDGQELGERPLPIDADTFRIWTKMTPSRETVAAMPADNVPFAGNEVARRKTLNPFADALHDTNKFMPDDHWYRDRLLRPGIPVINVNVGPADRSFFNPNEYVIVAYRRHRDFFQPKTWLRFAFDQRLHRLLHGLRLGESRIQESRKVQRSLLLQRATTD